jgi:hypothetical protein
MFSPVIYSTYYSCEARQKSEMSRSLVMVSMRPCCLQLVWKLEVRISDSKLVFCKEIRQKVSVAICFARTMRAKDRWPGGRIATASGVKVTNDDAFVTFRHCTYDSCN